MDNKDLQAEKPDALLPEEDAYVGRFQQSNQPPVEAAAPEAMTPDEEAPALPDEEIPESAPEEAPESAPEAVTEPAPETALPEEGLPEEAPEILPEPAAEEAPLLDPAVLQEEEISSDPPEIPTEAPEIPSGELEAPAVENGAEFPAPEVPDVQPPAEMTLSEIEAILHPQEPEASAESEPEIAPDTDGAEIDDITRILSGIAPEVPEEVSPVPEMPEQAAAPDLSEAELPQVEIPEESTEKEEPPADQAFQNAADGEEFDEMFHAEPEPPKTPTHKRPARKGRPKRRKGEGFFGIPNLIVTLVWLGITVLIGVTLGRMVWVCAADVLAFGREDKPVTITIYETDTIDDITQKLYEGELIHYPGLFKFYASLAVDEGEIQPGIWDLNTRYDYHALVNMMSPSSSREVIKVMIPEGYTSRQIFSLLEENKVCTIRDLSAYAADGELEDYWFLEGVTRGDPYCLDGFLFPDTYQFYKNESPENVLDKLLSNFNNRFDEEMQAQIATLNEHLTALMRKGGKSEDFIAQNQFTVRDVVIVASMIEKETSSAEEGSTIASVIYNRLFNWGDNPAYLNIDASIVYALEGKTDLTQDDLKVDSPYNTYTHTGLTPGAISNPGLASLKAALAPQDTNYYYYVLDPSTGSHRFTTTYDEHQAAIASIGGQE